MLAEGASFLPRRVSKAGQGKRDFPRATSWLQYDYYDFLTKPELRPADPTGEKAFWETLERMRSRLLSLSVLGRLSDSYQLELAALVCDFMAAHEMYESFRKAMVAFRQLSSLLGRRNIAKIKKAAGLLRPLAATIPGHHPHTPGVSLKNLVSALDEFVRQLPWRTKRAAAAYVDWAKQNYPQTSDPNSEATWQLFSFFISKCRLPRNEAEVRVAKIGNACLNWDVLYTEAYQGADSWKGCPAVRQRISRYHTKKPRSQRDSP